MLTQVGTNWRSLSPESSSGTSVSMSAESWRIYKSGSGMWRLLRESHKIVQRYSKYVKGGRGSPVLIPRDRKRSMEVIYTEDSEHPDQKEWAYKEMQICQCAAWKRCTSFNSTSPGHLLNPRDKRLKACWIITEKVVVNWSLDPESRLTVCQVKIELDSCWSSVILVEIIDWFGVCHSDCRDVFKMHGLIGSWEMEIRKACVIRTDYMWIESAVCAVVLYV